MTDIITRNPFRVLGVYTNAHQREIVANAAKIRAFAKIGKSPTFPVDSINVGAPVVRTEAAVQEALAAIALPKDKLAASLFWFAEVGTAEESSSESRLLSIRSNSTYVNLAVHYLLAHDYKKALLFYACLPHKEYMLQEYEEMIVGDPLTVSVDEFAGMLADNLMQHFPDVAWHTCLQAKTAIIGGSSMEVGGILAGTPLRRPIMARTTAGYEKTVRDAIAKAAQTDSKDAAANLVAAKQLQSAVKSPLAALKDILGADDKKYAALADAAANQLLNNFIDYGNNTKDRDRAEKILPIVRYAMALAQGMVVKERVKKNYDIIKEEYDQIEAQNKEYMKLFDQEYQKALYHNEKETDPILSAYRSFCRLKSHQHSSIGHFAGCEW